VRHAVGESLVKFPDSLAVGDFVNYVVPEMKKEEGRQYKYQLGTSSITLYRK